ncbi:MAG TPA: hypothetical protein VES19_12265 [Candidatus Limnocylindrales bacterium]|nr:hypothetical protein [Candidatus Limnocylindrales bacterium]
MLHRRAWPVSAVIAFAVVTGCGAGVPRSTAPASAAPASPASAEPAPDGPAAAPTERVVGGIAFREVPVASVEPALGPNEADAVVREELGAGRATLATEAEGVPAMRTVDGAFVPGLVGATGPAGQPLFDVDTPVPAWVIVMEGRGADGLYLVIGVVDDRTGRPLTVYVDTPGSG